MKNFGNVGNLWCLLDELWLEFWGALKLWSFGNVRIYLCIGSTCRIFILLSGKCRIFFFFLAQLWKNLVVVYGHVKNFDCGEILLGHWFFVMGHWLFFLGAWESFGYVILVMGIFWTCGNFKWDKFRIHLMRSCSTKLNLSWLALMEFALMRQSWMLLV